MKIGLETLGWISLAMLITLLVLECGEGEAEAVSSDREMRELVKANQRQAKALEEIVSTLRDIRNESKKGKRAHRIDLDGRKRRCSLDICDKWYSCTDLVHLADDRDGAPCTFSECRAQWPCAK